MSVQARALAPRSSSRRLRTFWTYIPHFIHSPFYVYAYAFGDCLVNSLYAVYQDAESGFQAKYFDMLRAGGTKHHSELLAPFGLDASDPAFWQKGLSVIEAIVDELEAMDDAKMSETVVLATYRSSRCGGDGDPRFSLRSSLWRREEDGSWRMVFHQGTAVQTP
jgi:hypothetical protein